MHSKTPKSKAEIKEAKRAYALAWYHKNKHLKNPKKNTTTKDTTNIKFNGSEKEMVRNTVLKCAKKTKDLFDFYGGSGEMYHLANKVKNLNITSIDDGRSFNNQKELTELFKNLKGTKLTSLETVLSNATEADQKGTIWLDYCGPLSTTTRNDLRNLYPIMKKKGYFFITLLKGRETIMSAGTDREIIDAITQSYIKKDLKEAGVKITPMFSHEYKSIPEYEGRKIKGATPIGVYGFKYTKDEAKIKRLMKKKANALKSLYSVKQTKDMIKALETLGYIVNSPN